MTRMAVAVVVFTVALAAFSQASGDNRTAEVLLQAGQVREIIYGDLKGAIALYQQAFDEGKSDRPLAARALLALGLAREKAGTGDARAVFTRIVQDFSDLQEVASRARARLVALGPLPGRRQAVGPQAQRVFSSETFRGTSVSRDGRFIAGLVELGGGIGDLVVRDTFSGQMTKLAAGSLSGMPSFPLMSPDGRSVAYLWSETIPDMIFMNTSIRVIGTEPGAATKVLFTADPS